MLAKAVKSPNSLFHVKEQRKEVSSEEEKVLAMLLAEEGY
jgi:hypothetical protein